MTLVPMVWSTRKGSLSTRQRGEWWGKASILALARDITRRHIATYIASRRRADYCRGILRGEYIAASSQRQCSLQQQPVAAAIKEAAFHLQQELCSVQICYLKQELWKIRKTKTRTTKKTSMKSIIVFVDVVFIVIVFVVRQRQRRNDNEDNDKEGMTMKTMTTKTNTNTMTTKTRAT